MAVSNLKRIELGGGLSRVVGNITHTEGAAEETFTVAGGRIVGFQVLKNDSDSISDITGNVPITWSVSGHVITITIYGVSGITSGTFYIDVDNG